MEYFLCLNFYDITTITLLLMGCWLATIIPKEYFNVEICWTKAWIPNPPGFRSAQRWCVFISSQTNQRQGLGIPSVKNAMKARGLHIIWKVYIFLTSLPYMVEIAGNKNSINFSWLTYSKNDWSGWLHLFFCSGKGDKRQIDPRHFIIIIFWSQTVPPEWPLYHATNLGTAQICDRVFSFEAIVSTNREQRKTLSGSEVIGLQVVYPDDRIVFYALPSDWITGGRGVLVYMQENINVLLFKNNTLIAYSWTSSCLLLLNGSGWGLGHTVNFFFG